MKEITGYHRDTGHNEALIRKYQRIAGLGAIKLTWELNGMEPDDPYMVGLDKRIKQAEAQFNVMRP